MFTEEDKEVRRIRLQLEDTVESLREVGQTVEPIIEDGDHVEDSVRREALSTAIGHIEAAIRELEEVS